MAIFLIEPVAPLTAAERADEISRVAYEVIIPPNERPDKDSTSLYAFARQYHKDQDLAAIICVGGFHWERSANYHKYLKDFQDLFPNVPPEEVQRIDDYVSNNVYIDWNIVMPNTVPQITEQQMIDDGWFLPGE